MFSVLVFFKDFLNSLLVFAHYLILQAGSYISIRFDSVYISFHSVHLSSYSARNLPKLKWNFNIGELNLKMRYEIEKKKKLPFLIKYSFSYFTLIHFFAVSVRQKTVRILFLWTIYLS